MAKNPNKRNYGASKLKGRSAARGKRNHEKLNAINAALIEKKLPTFTTLTAYEKARKADRALKAIRSEEPELKRPEKKSKREEPVVEVQPKGWTEVETSIEGVTQLIIDEDLLAAELLGAPYVEALTMQRKAVAA